ncbi:MAG: CocE/NonD family hydrolase [Chloroflexota bacterium]
MRDRKLLGVLGLALMGLGVYRFRRQFLSRWLGLRPVRHKVVVQRGLQVTMQDGVCLATDHYAPVSKRLLPTILMRTPYGRSGSAGWSGLLPDFLAQRFAERGYNVIVQDVRGRFDSQGEFDPFTYEVSDGRATLAWIEKQNWFNGVLGMWGQSYLGYVQWAVAPGGPLYLKALVPAISGSQLSTLAWRDRAFSLDTLLHWLLHLETMHQARGRGGALRLGKFSPRWQERQIARAIKCLPISQADEMATGKTAPFYQVWLEGPPEESPEEGGLYPKLDVQHVTAAVHLIGGWHDILLRETLYDYAALRKSGRQPYLTIGPWGHVDFECTWESLRQGIDWFDAQLKGDHYSLRAAPVRVYVTGAEGWRDLESWPPLVQPERYFLHGSSDARGKRAGSLSRQGPEGDNPPTTYCYDPAHPTPALGGALMSQHAGSYDNRSLESRPDVLTFTSAPLEQGLEIMGETNLVLFARSSLEHTDFFARLCDVHPNGRSMNICDGLLRLSPGRVAPQADGSLRLELNLWPSAHRFQAGHRLRLQVSSGAHPRWNRNLGTGEPLRYATRMQSAQQEIFHDPEHCSVLILPVSGSGG